MKPQSKRNSARWILGVLLVAGALLFGITLQWLRERRPESVSADADGRAVKRSSTHGRPEPATQSLVTDSELADETPPWQATPNETPSLPPGTVPAWRVDPPPPDPSVLLPPSPIEPPNPAEHRPSIHNPGGVNRDRPERPVSGLE